MYPKWNLGKWKLGLQPGVPLLFNFDPHRIQETTRDGLWGAGDSAVLSREPESFAESFPRAREALRSNWECGISPEPDVGAMERPRYPALF